MEKEFDGFDHPNHTQVPNDFFDKLLPLIKNESELRVTLAAIRNTLGWQRSEAKLSHTYLMVATGMSRKAVRDGLAAALLRGTMTLEQKQTHTAAAIYGIRWNKERYPQGTSGGIPRVRQEVSPGYITKKGKKEKEKESTGAAQRPNIFATYEQNIGLLTPLIADELKAAEMEYPSDWIEPAFLAAVSANVRRWAYVRTILERWKAQGHRDEGKSKPRGNGTKGAMINDFIRSLGEEVGYGKSENDQRDISPVHGNLPSADQ